MERFGSTASEVELEPGVQTVNVMFESINGDLGFQLLPIFPPHVVSDVLPNSHAARNGLWNGDVVAFIGGFDVQELSADELWRFLENATQHGAVPGLVYRSGLCLVGYILLQFIVPFSHSFCSFCL
jgi:hypothetical protein